MMYLQDDSGNVIDLPEDFQIYKSAVNLFSFTIKGNFSTTFQVPNDSYFKRSFNYFSPLQVPSQGFTATLFNYVRNGNALDRGQLILEREDNDYLYFFFASGNSNWLTLVPDISIKDIDYEDFTAPFNGNAFDYQNVNSGFCFPMLENGFNGQRNNYSTFYNVIWDSSSDLENAVPSFYPCFFLVSAMQEVFKSMQLKIGGDILNDPIFNQMIITPDSGKIKRANKFYNDRKVIINVNSSKNLGQITADTFQQGAMMNWDAVYNIYWCDKSCVYDVRASVYLGTSFFPVLQLFKNGILVNDYRPNNIDNYYSSTSGYLDYHVVSQINNTGSNSQQSETQTGNYNTWINIPLSCAANKGDYLFVSVAIGGTNKGNWAADGSQGYVPNSGAANIADYWTVSVAGNFGFTPVPVGVGDIVQAQINTPGGFNVNWSVIPLANQKYIAGSTVTISPIEKMSPQIGQPFDPNTYIFTTQNRYPITGVDTIRASDILPDIKFIEFIKFVCQYFCLIPSYDQTTSTVNFNKLDNYDYTQAIDISDYVQNRENNYQIKTAKYNYIRFNDSIEDKNIENLFSNNIGYGDIMVQGQSQTKISNDIYKLPFGATIDKLTKNNAVLLSHLNMFEIDYGDPIQIKNVVSAASNLASLIPYVNTSNSGYIICPRLYYFSCSNKYYDGFIISLVSIIGNTQSFITDIPFTSNASGTLWPVRFKHNEKQSRILFYTGFQNLSNFSKLSSINIFENGYEIAKTSIGWAYFSKPNTNYSVSSYKQGLNLDYTTLGNYNDIPLKYNYYKTLSRILNSPYVKVWAYIPELVFAQIKFDKLVYIKDKDNQTFYLIDSIENYRDSKTLCIINLLAII